MSRETISAEQFVSESGWNITAKALSGPTDNGQDPAAQPGRLSLWLESPGGTPFRVELTPAEARLLEPVIAQAGLEPETKQQEANRFLKELGGLMTDEQKAHFGAIAAV